MNKLLINKIFDVEPQIVAVEYGAEPSLREILEEYFLSGGMSRKKTKKLIDKYMAEIVRSLK